MKLVNNIFRAAGDLPGRCLAKARSCWRQTDYFIRRHVADIAESFEAAPDLPVLLMCDQAVPEPDTNAGDRAVALYLSLFRSLGWRTLFCPLYPCRRGLPMKRLALEGVTVIDSPKALRRWLESYGKTVTLSWLARPAVTQAFLRDVRRHTCAPVIYFTHDVHSLRLEREARVLADGTVAAKAVAMKKAEAAIFEAVDGILAPGDHEVAEIRKLTPHKPVASIPLHFFDDNEMRVRPARHFERLNSLVFVGGFPHTPNIDAAIFMVNQVMPLIWQHRPDVTLFLVGHSPPACVQTLANDRVVVTGRVAEITSFYDRARVALLGLRYGAGVKGKTLEAFRMGVPVSGTGIAVEGIKVIPGRDALVSDSAQGLAENTLALLNDPDLCARLSAAGHELLKQHYSRQQAVQALQTIINISGFRK